MGPTTKSITVAGGVTFPQLIEVYLRARQAAWWRAARISCWSKPANDTRNVKAALLAIERLRARAAARRIPDDGLGHHRDHRAPCWPGRPPTRSARPSLHADLLSIGLNCGTGPEFMTDHLRTIARWRRCASPAIPTPACPTRKASTWRRPTTVAAQLERFIDNGWLNIVGGCCGTTDAHIRAIAQMAEGKRPRPVPGALAPRLLFRHRAGGGRREQPPADRRRAHQRHRLAPVQEHGGRREVGGSHRDRALAGEERRAHRGRLPANHRPRRDRGHPAVLRQADPQDQSAGHDRHHRSQGAWSWRSPTARARASSTPSTWRTAKRSSSASAPSPGATARRWWWARIDEDKLQAQAFTRERKLAVAERSYQLLTGKVRHPARGHHHRSAGVSLRHRRRQLHRRGGRDHRRHPPGEGEAAVRQDGAGHFQHLVRPAGGGARGGELGLPVLLHQGRARPGHRQRREAGALRVHSRRGAAPGGEPAVQFARRWMRPTNRCAPRPRTGGSRPPEQKAAINQFHIAAITEHFRKTGKRVKQHAEDLPLDQRLANYIIEGTKDGLVADLDRKLRRRRRAARHHQRAADGRAWPKWAGCSTTTS